jgi:hypothetical protein
MQAGGHDYHYSGHPVKLSLSHDNQLGREQDTNVTTREREIALSLLVIAWSPNLCSSDRAELPMA